MCLLQRTLFKVECETCRCTVPVCFWSVRKTFNWISETTQVFVIFECALLFKWFAHEYEYVTQLIFSRKKWESRIIFALEHHIQTQKKYRVTRTMKNKKKQKKTIFKGEKWSLPQGHEKQTNGNIYWDDDKTWVTGTWRTVYDFLIIVNCSV